MDADVGPGGGCDQQGASGIEGIHHAAVRVGIAGGLHRPIRVRDGDQPEPAEQQEPGEVEYRHAPGEEDEGGGADRKVEDRIDDHSVLFPHLAQGEP